MRARVWLVAVALFGVGLLVGVLSPSLKAQAVADPCSAPWVVVEGVERPSASSAQRGGWHAVKLNRCTGEAQIFASKEHSVSEKDAWYKLAVK
jgi:hypothetical protein